MTAEPIVGRVAQLYRYPVKSMAGEAVATAKVRFSGIEGDRRYAFVRADGSKALQIDFPWFTGREYPALVAYQALYDAGTADITVTAPDGSTHALDSDSLREALERESGKAVSLLRLGRGTYDGAPLSLLSTRSVDTVAQAAALSDRDARRYRPNLLLELADGAHEDDWVGKALTVGSGGAVIWVTRPDPRCMMINLDPATGQQTPAVLKYVATARANMLGVYATVLREGIVNVGDELRLHGGL